jgi:predicted regulator of Ras-like GTPase activity (Roadblock/LC7/MglB family)
MPFKRLLARWLDLVPGALGAIIVDWEGEAVDQVARMDSYELQVLGAHKGVILANLRDAVSRLGDEEIEEIVIATANNQTLILPLTPEYALILTLARGEALGRALFEARRCAAELRREIA